VKFRSFGVSRRYDQPKAGGWTVPGYRETAPMLCVWSSCSCLASAALVFSCHRTWVSLHLGEDAFLRAPGWEFLWSGGCRNCFRHYRHVEHQRKGEADLVTDLLWKSWGRLLIAAKSCALPCQPQHQKAPSELFSLSQKSPEGLTPSAGVLGFSRLLWRLGVVFASCILPFQVTADHLVTFSPEAEERRFPAESCDLWSRPSQKLQTQRNAEYYLKAAALRLEKHRQNLEARCP